LRRLKRNLTLSFHRTREKQQIPMSILDDEVFSHPSAAVPPVIETRSKLLCVIGAVLVGVFITAFVFYPGVMSPDSLDQFGQAQRGQISGDVFPPSWRSSGGTQIT
jgi:hypothetical protein